MGLTAAAGGFVVFLLSVPVVQGQKPVVTYSSTDICAPRGASVNMSCTFSHESSLTIETKCWHPQDDWNCNLDNIDPATYICDDKNKCTLRIVDLKDSDAKRYMFRIIAEGTNKWTFSPGVKLTVTALQMHVTRVKVNVSHTEAELSCTSTCTRPSYVWFKNGLKVPEEAASYTGHLEPGDGISCALKGHEGHRVPSLYAPKFPSVSVSPSGEVMEDSSVTLTCSSDANIVANYTWYKRNETEPLSIEPQLVISSIQSSDCGQYYCTAENQLGRRETQICIDVKYAPKRPSVSVSPSGEIVEGSSVTLTCSSDANPAANYTWYKEHQTRPHGEGAIYSFPSISSEDRGIYYCKSENKHGWIDSTSLSVDVQYAPKLPSVSVSPSAEIVEGSSVTLTCSSDANPAANYTWYKENHTPLSEEPQLVFSSIQSSDSGQYYCRAENQLGRTSKYINVDVKYAPTLPSVSRWILPVVAAGTVSALIILFILVSVSLWIRKTRAPKEPPVKKPDDSAQKQPAEKQDGLQYAIVNFSKKRADPLYSNITPSLAPRHKREENVDTVEYATVKFNSGNTLPGWTLILSMRTTQTLQRRQKTQRSRKTRCEGLSGESLLLRPMKRDDFRVTVTAPDVVQGQIPVGTYSSTDICAPRGSTVNMSCTFRHESSLTITKTCWYPEGRFDRNCDSVYIDRATYFCDGKNKSTLRIVDLKDSDAKTYMFRIIAEGTGNRWSFYPGVKLTVTALQMHVTRVKVNVSHTEAELSCTSTCTRPSYVWFKNGLKVPEEAASYTGHLEPGDGISCALKGHEDHRVPSLYAPKFPSVCSEEFLCVTNYTWYKKDEDSPKASGQIFIIADIRAEHSGSYSCEAQNNIGRSNSSIHLTVVAGSWKYAAAGTMAVVLLAVLSLSVFLWIRKKKASRNSSEPEERPDNREQDLPDQGQQEEQEEQEEQGELQYASVRFSNKQADSLYSNIRPAQALRHTEQQEVVEYAAVQFNSAPRIRDGEDPAALYSTVNNTQ
ncbi:hypothetical protein VZT92_003298 [Zoarces viviparus]|uniref:B-cell receptor CD22 n=1 Tax=Zoarces viviparus TaxID=48416 RepID=A0AAW1G115_ZOAVI